MQARSPSRGVGTDPCALEVLESVPDTLPTGPQPAVPRVSSSGAYARTVAPAPRAGTADSAADIATSGKRACVPAPTSSNTPATAHARHVARHATGAWRRSVASLAPSSACPTSACPTSACLPRPGAAAQRVRRHQPPCTTRSAQKSPARGSRLQIRSSRTKAALAHAAWSLIG